MAAKNADSRSTEGAPQPASSGLRVLTATFYRGRGAMLFAEPPPPPPPPEPTRRPAYVAQLLALAHRFEAALSTGEHRNQAALARLHGVDNARITQILDLLLLAPDIQEEVLHLEALDDREPTLEQRLRSVLRGENWAEQRVLWRRVRATGISRKRRRAP